MSPVDQAGPVTGTNSPLVPKEKRPKILGTSSGAKFGNKATWRNTKILTFAPIIASEINSSSCITAVKWDAYDVENTAGYARRCHPDHLNSSCFHPGNLSEVFIWQNFQPAYRDLENRASLPSHINASNILQRI